MSKPTTGGIFWGFLGKVATLFERLCSVDEQVRGFDPLFFGF